MFRFSTETRDPKSIEFIEWSPVTAVTFKGATVYMVRCKFRGKNAFGSLVINEKIFRMSSNGTVLASWDYGS